jgi:hypothetical protein
VQGRLRCSYRLCGRGVNSMGQREVQVILDTASCSALVFQKNLWLGTVRWKRLQLFDQNFLWKPTRNYSIDVVATSFLASNSLQGELNHLRYGAQCGLCQDRRRR